MQIHLEVKLILQARDNIFAQSTLPTNTWWIISGDKEDFRFHQSERGGLGKAVPLLMGGVRTIYACARFRNTSRVVKKDFLKVDPTATNSNGDAG